MIELPKEDVIEILKALSRVEGYLLSLDDSECIADVLDYPVNLLTNKLNEENNV